MAVKVRFLLLPSFDWQPRNREHQTARLFSVVQSRNYTWKNETSTEKAPDNWRGETRNNLNVLLYDEFRLRRPITEIGVHSFSDVNFDSLSCKMQAPVCFTGSPVSSLEKQELNCRIFRFFLL